MFNGPYNFVTPIQSLTRVNNNNNLHIFIYIFRAPSKDGCCSANLQMGSYEQHHLEIG